MKQKTTLQKIFNKVKRHLLKQNKKAWSETKGCMYLNKDGDKCAVGCLIFKKDYNPDIEGQTAHDPLVHKCLPFVITQKRISFLAKLQEIHDNSEPDQWPGKLENLAKEYNLKYS